MPADMARHRAHLSGWLWVLPSLAIPLVITAVAWTGHVASEGDEIAPNVEFAGIDMAGLSPDRAAEHVSWREDAFLETAVTIDLGERRVTLTAEEIGFDYLHQETLAAVVSARHGDGAWSEFLSWVTVPFETMTVEDRFALDGEVAMDRLDEGDFVLEPPVEPGWDGATGTMTVIPGVDGVGIDAEQLIEALARADIAAGPVEIEAEHTPVPPSMADERAAEIATEINEMTENGITAALGLRTGRLSAAQVRRHVLARVEAGELAISIDTDGFQQDLESLFPEQRGDLQKPALEVVEGEVRVIEEGVPPPVCCSARSVRATADQLLDGGAPIYQLETRPSENETMVEWAKGSQVKEVVGEFTTNHACCENRVVNIQTMADQLRGFYLVPGETISFNEYVGPRTREKGYVAAGAIRGGYLTDEVGGGVSQFVTTMFNAAFFGGLDLDQYQSHSVYFSRYPFGREATLSIPGPDLVLTNNTEYPVLIWPTYDSTSITVSLYSTKHIDVEEIDQRVTFRGQCRHSEIDRQRTYPDGRVQVDTIVANYRPGDGIDCNGNVIPRRD